MIGLSIPPPQKSADHSPRVSGIWFPLSLFHIAVMAIVSAAAVLVGEFLINKIYFGESIVFGGRWLALVCNILILSCFMIVL